MTGGFVVEFDTSVFFKLLASRINDLLQQSKEFHEREMAAQATVRDLQKKLMDCTKETSQAMLTIMDLIKNNELLKNETELLRKELNAYAAVHQNGQDVVTREQPPKKAARKKRRVDHYDPHNYSDEDVEVSPKTLFI